MSGRTNRIVSLLFVCEREMHKGVNIAKISIKEKGGVRNAKRSWVENGQKYEQK